MRKVKGKPVRLLVTVGACAVVALWSLVGAARTHPATAQNPPQGGCYPNNELTMDLALMGSNEGPPGTGPGAFSASGNFPRLSFPNGMEVDNPNGVSRQGVNNVSLTFDETVTGNTPNPPFPDPSAFDTISAGSMAGKVKIVIDLGSGRMVGFSGSCVQEAQVIQEDNPSFGAVEAEYEGFVTGMPGQELAPSSQTSQGGRAVASITVNPPSDPGGLFTVNIGIELGRTCAEEVFGPTGGSSIEIGLGGGTGLPQANSLYPQGYRTQGTRTAGRWGFPNGFVDDSCTPPDGGAARPRTNVRPAGPGRDPGDPHLPPRRARPR